MLGGIKVNINLNLYKIFYITAQSKTILEASEKLYISQPAVSKSIRNLEKALSIQLLYRSKNGIELTPEGKEVFNYLDKCYNYLVAGEKILEDKKNLKVGNLTIGVPSHIASFYLLDYIKKFTGKHPNIKVRLVSSSTKNLINNLYNHQLDLIIDTPPIDITQKDMRIKKLTELQTTFITNNIDDTTNFDMSNMDNYKYIFPNESSPMARALYKKLKEYEICLKPNIEVDTTDVIISAVKKGLGVGYVVRKAVEKELSKGEISELILPIELPKLQLNLVYMDNYVTSAAKEFIANISIEK